MTSHTRKIAVQLPAWLFQRLYAKFGDEQK